MQSIISYQLVVVPDKENELLDIILKCEGVNHELPSYRFSNDDDGDDLEEAVSNCIAFFKNVLSSYEYSFSEIQWQEIKEKLRDEFWDFEDDLINAQQDFDPSQRHASHGVIERLLLNNGCAIATHFVDSCFENIKAGKRLLFAGENGIPKNIRFLDSAGRKFFAPVQEIICFDKQAPQDLTIQGEAAIVFISDECDFGILISCRNIRESTSSGGDRTWKYYAYSQEKAQSLSITLMPMMPIYKAEPLNLRPYIVERCQLKFGGGIQIPELSAALQYYEKELSDLFLEENKKTVELDVQTLRENYSVFSELAPDDYSFILPIFGDAKRIESISVKTVDEEGEKKTTNFFGVGVEVISKGSLEEYEQRIWEDGGLFISEGDSLCRVVFDDINREKYDFDKIINNGYVQECYFETNIEGERARLRRIISGIESAMKGAGANQSLVETVCTNNIGSKLDWLLSAHPYEPDGNYIEYLKNTYPILAQNTEQLEALDKILQMPQKELDVMLIQGPPGTGKTELILSLAKELTEKHYKTLVTSNVHVACDNIVERLKDNKDLVLKRYTTVRGERYEREIIENQKNYVGNQVLAGFSCNDQDISSRDVLESLRAQIDSLRDDIKVEIAKKEGYDNELKEYRQLMADQAEAKAVLTEVNDKIIPLYQEKLINCLKYVGIVREYEAYGDIIDELCDKQESVEKDIRDRQADIEKEKLSYQVYATGETFNQQIAILSNNNIEINASIKALNDTIAGIKKEIKGNRELNADEYVAGVIAAVKAGKGKEQLDKLALTSDVKKRIELLSNAYGVLKSDKDFFSGKANLKASTLEYFYFLKGDAAEALREFCGADISNELETVYRFYKTPEKKKQRMELFSFFKLDGKSFQYYHDNIIQLQNSLKQIQYSFDSILASHFAKVISKETLAEEISTLELALNEKTVELEKLNASLKRNNAEIKRLENQRQDDETQAKAILVSLTHLQQTINPLRDKVRRIQEEIALEKSKAEPLYLKICEYSEQAEKLNREINTTIQTRDDTERKLTAIEVRLAQVSFEKQRQIDSYDLNVSNANIRISNLRKLLAQIERADKKIAGKIELLLRNGWSKEKAYSWLFGYVSELRNIVSCSDDGRINKYFQGRGDTFNRLFSIRDNSSNGETGSLISMTTNQVASLLNDDKDLTFDFVIVDEASKCRFEDLIISLPRTKHLVLIGDFMQLDPMYDEFERLPYKFQRLFDNEAQWDSLNKSSFSALLAQVVEYNEKHAIMSLSKNPCVAVMKRQYRMNEGIFSIIAPIYSIHSGFELIDEKHAKSNDVMCIQVDGAEEKDGTSYLNTKEADSIIAFLQAFQKDRKQFPGVRTVGLITGYRPQERYFRRRLSQLKVKISGLQIGTFDRFQGREYDLVLVSMVRTEKLGFTSNIRRMNVAFSRAKSHLIIYGNLSKLAKVADRLPLENTGDMSDTERQEALFVAKTLVPQLSDLRQSFVSQDERTNAALSMIKEANA